MTRFARAKGSKASNERVTEQATPWTTLKQGLLENLTNKNDFQEICNQKIANYKTFLKEKEEEQAKNVVWASFPTQKSDNPFLNAKNKNKEKKSMHKNENSTHSDSGTNKTKEMKKKKLKIVTAAEDKVQNENKKSITSVNLGKKVKVTKKGKVKSQVNGENSTLSVLDKIETEEIPEKTFNVISNQKKKRKKSEERKELESNNISKKKRKRQQSIENIDLESNNINDKKKKKKKEPSEENIGLENNMTDKKKKRKKKQSEENNAGNKKIKKKIKKLKKEEKDLTEEDIQKIEKKKQKKIKQLLKKKQFKQKLNDQQNAPENEIKKSDEPEITEEIVTIPDSELLKNDNEKNIEKKIKKHTTAVKNKKVKQMNGEYQRRKPNLPHKMFVNGKELELAYVDGFPVKKEDGDRLKKLRREMISKGLPRTEIDRALKLERRRAEKALAREKKKVCFNCRNSGHNLSECPELGKDQLVETTGSGICFKCGSSEHTHFECKVVKGQEYKFAQCFICNEQGHIARQCPDNARGLYPKGGACRVCGDVTHLKKDCPQYQVQQQNEEDSLKLDTLGNHNPEFMNSPSDIKIDKNTKKQNKLIKFV